MKQGEFLVILDDPRLSRLICHVADELHIACQAINKTDDIGETLDKTRPDVILLDLEHFDTQSKTVFQKLAEQHSEAAIILAHIQNDESEILQLGHSLGLNIVGSLPDVFDANILKQEFVSIFQKLDHRNTNKSAINTDGGLTI